ncbi:uncharacterized protein PHACADRAFT_182566 [Phanerochaete carnosa HHB-10118-sp]|uniref:C2H2-type domain-containing protein n=1 Tax=Phanerochaete carnosa (strain HHB-10118-sp) TaxID=650164 RepID=K5WGG9_PHACS|nr:uncharacterized protein PHACADRAFT_182566 [Phanerochaete carnosa HHB-10118-sp]EKM58199.1 hypothetical protein PHACADRAFT_182566 [Phanerochaete carnosa HHB-10118-sp]
MSTFTTIQHAFEIAQKTLQQHLCMWPKCNMKLNCWHTLAKHTSNHCNAVTQQIFITCFWPQCQTTNIQNKEQLYTHLYEYHLAALNLCCPVVGCRMQSMQKDMLMHLQVAHGQGVLVHAEAMQSTNRPISPTPATLPALPDMSLPQCGSSIAITSHQVRAQKELAPLLSLPHQNSGYNIETDIQFADLNSVAVTKRLLEQSDMPCLNQMVMLPIPARSLQLSQPEEGLSAGTKPLTAKSIFHQKPISPFAGFEAFKYHFNTEKMFGLLDSSGQFSSPK